MSGSEPEEYYLHTYEIDLKESTFNRLNWKEKVLISEASFLIPSKFVYCTRILFWFLVGENDFNCLVIGRNSVLICQEKNRKFELETSLFQETTSLIGYCPIDDGRRYLLTDNSGKLYLLILERDKRNGSSITTVIDMKVIPTKEISVF